MGQLLLEKFLLFLPTVRHVEKPSHNGEGRGRQSLLFTVCCRYLWSKESFVSLVGGGAADCLFANIAVARIAFLLFCRFSSLFILPLPPSASVSSVLFVRLSPVTLVAPSPPPSSILEWSTDEDPYSATKLHLQKRENIFWSGKQASIPALSLLSPDPVPDLRGLIMLGSFEAR